MSLFIPDYGTVSKDKRFRIIVLVYFVKFRIYSIRHFLFYYFQLQVEKYNIIEKVMDINKFYDINKSCHLYNYLEENNNNCKRKKF